jgi:lipopolysaccharide biosynthesis glycosyltransferase
MNTLAVTAGVRYWYNEAAVRFTNRFNRLAAMIDDGFQCVNANDLLPWDRIKDHRFCKSHLWDVLPASVDRIMWFDCDCFQVRPIGLSELPDVPFAAALDTKWCEEKTREKWNPGNDVVQFFNSGVMVCKRETRDVFDQVKAISDEMTEAEEPGGDHGDQRWLNVFIARKYKDFVNNPTGWHELPYEWNAIKGRRMPLRPIVIHYAGVWERWYYMQLMYNAMEEVERFARR